MKRLISSVHTGIRFLQIYLASVTSWTKLCLRVAVTHHRIFSRGLYTNFCLCPTHEQLWTLATDQHEQYCIMFALSALLKCWKWSNSSPEIMQPHYAIKSLIVNRSWVKGHNNIATQLLWNHLTSEFNSLHSFMQKYLGVSGMWLLLLLFPKYTN